jgi:hypothetical protein
MGSGREGVMTDKTATDCPYMPTGKGWVLDIPAGREVEWGLQQMAWQVDALNRAWNERGRPSEALDAILNHAAGRA